MTGRQLTPLTALAVAIPAMMATAYAIEEAQPQQTDTTEAVIDLIAASEEDTRYTSLSEEDFSLVAEQLEVEKAAIKAVVLIEAGNNMQGFWAPGAPVVNFSPTMYNKYCGKVSGRKVKDGKIPDGLSGYGLKQWTQLVNARKKNADAADMGTFWGMFQIGGFNYKFCDCRNVEEMADRMCKSELEQLELFASFIRNAKMLDDLRNKNWSGFARKYNGASYAKRKYHTRMANAYDKFKKEEGS